MFKHKRGDVREDGMIFWGKNKNYISGEDWVDEHKYKLRKEKRNIELSTKAGHIKRNLSVIKQRAKTQNLNFDLTFEYLEATAPEKCPVFNVNLSWGRQTGKINPTSPSLDRIVPELGYVKGNVRWLSHLANTMKSNATQEELKAFAKWILNNEPN
jgi:hypothetical protein